MKIAFYARSLSHGAGIGRYGRSLLNELSKIPDNEIVLISNRSALAAPQLQTIYSQRSNPLSILYWEHFKVPRLVLDQSADVFYNPDFVLPLKCPCPGVVTIHDLSFMEMPQYTGIKARLYYGAFVGRTVAQARNIITDSQYSRGVIKKYFPHAAKKVSVAYPAADERFHPHYDQNAVRAAIKKYGISDKYILYVGLLGGWKNLAGLVASYGAIVEQMDVHHQLVLAGRSCRATRKIESAIAAKRLQNKVKLLMNVSDDELPLLYNRASVFAFPSLMEGFGLPPLEAMHCGVPVVCTTAGALPEVTGDAAWQVPPGDNEAMAKALLGMVNTRSLREEYAQRGLERAKSFSWQACAKQVTDVFHGVK